MGTEDAEGHDELEDVCSGLHVGRALEGAAEGEGIALEQAEAEGVGSVLPVGSPLDAPAVTDGVALLSSETLPASEKVAHAETLAAEVGESDALPLALVAPVGDILETEGEAEAQVVGTKDAGVVGVA